jgi:hypothetical protein
MMGQVAVTEVTPLLIEEVATQVGMPLDIARTNPLVPFAVTERAPVPPEVVTRPFVVRFESVEMFWEVFTEKAEPS